MVILRIDIAERGRVKTIVLSRFNRQTIDYDSTGQGYLFQSQKKPS